MARSSTYFAPDAREQLRRRLLQRGSILAGLLAEVHSGKDNMFMLQALGVLRPGVWPKQALRHALEQVERSRLRLISDDARYGCCETCGTDLDIAALEQKPWADRCPAHAA